MATETARVDPLRRLANTRHIPHGRGLGQFLACFAHRVGEAEPVLGILVAFFLARGGRVVHLGHGRPPHSGAARPPPSWRRPPLLEQARSSPPPARGRPPRAAASGTSTCGPRLLVPRRRSAGRRTFWFSHRRGGWVFPPAVSEP